MSKQESRAIEGEQRDAVVNFDTYNKSITERLCTLNTATMSTRAHLAPKPAQTGTWTLQKDRTFRPFKVIQGH